MARRSHNPPADFAHDLAEAWGVPVELFLEPYTTPLVFSAPGTALAVEDGRKTVTRRLASAPTCRWREGMLSRAYAKSPRVGGLAFGVVRITSARLEPIDAITPDDVAREGFGSMPVDAFVKLFRSLHEGCPQEWPWAVWRIEFRLVWVVR